MKASALFHSDSAQSLFLHAAKSALALLLNGLVLAQFSTADYVTWSVTCSIIAVATASDLGIGQYTVTRLIHTDRDAWAGIVGESLVAMLPLAVASVFFVFFFIDGRAAPYQWTMSILLGLRVLTIPFGAVLNAVNQFKVRKAIETGVYLLACMLIAAAAYGQLGVESALMIFNGAFLLGGGVTILAAGRYLRLGTPRQFSWRWRRLSTVYGESVPFMVNNLSGVFTYGGFLWIGSYFLSQEDMARLAILHTFVLMNLYQLYDVYLKSRQAELVNPVYVRHLSVSNGFVMLAVPLLMAVFGGDIWRIFLPGISIERLELLAFSIFIALELGSLFIQSLSQVSLGAARWVGHYAVVKLSCQALALVLYLQFPLQGDLASFVIWLAAGSAVAYLAVASHFRSAGGGSREVGGA